MLNGVVDSQAQQHSNFSLPRESNGLSQMHQNVSAPIDEDHNHTERSFYHQQELQSCDSHYEGHSKKRKRRRRSHRYADDYSLDGGDEDGGEAVQKDDGDEGDERPDFHTPYGNSHYPGGGKHGFSVNNRRKPYTSSKQYASHYRGSKRHHHESRRSSSGGGSSGGTGMMISSLPPGGTSTSHGGHGGIGRRPPRVTPIKHKKHDVKVKRLNLDEALKTANDGQVGCVCIFSSIALLHFVLFISEEDN